MKNIAWTITFNTEQGEDSCYYSAPTKEMAVRLFSLEYYKASFISITL
jgi:hypothetical protein